MSFSFRRSAVSITSHKSYVRIRRTFFVVLASMIAISVALCSLFIIFYSRQIVQATRQYRINTYQEYLNNIVNNTDYLFNENLHQSLIQLSLSNSLYSTAFFANPSEESVNALKADLASAISNNSLMDSAFVYLVKSDKVICSNHTTFALDDFYNSDLVHYYYEEPNSYSALERNGRISILFEYSGRSIIAQDFYLHGENRLGTIFCYVNLHEIYRSLNRSTSSNGQLFVYNESHLPVFSEETSYPDNISESKLIQLRRDTNYSVSDDGTVHIHTDSTVTRWIYLLLIDESDLQAASFEFTTLILFIFCILLFSVFVAYIIASILYRPFQQLFEIIRDYHFTQDSESPMRNEFDFLNYTFSEIKKHQSYVNSLMCEVSSDVISRLFIEILSGKQLERQYLQRILETTHSGFRANALYVALYILCDSELSSIYVRNEFQNKVQLVMEQLRVNDDFCFHVVQTDTQSIAIIIGFDENVSIAEGKRFVSLCCTKLTQEMVPNISIKISSGHLYHSILDVGFSYKEAQDILTGELNTPVVAVPDAMEAPANIKSNTNEGNSKRANQIVTLISDGDTDGAIILASRIIDEITNNGALLSTQRKNCIGLVAAIGDKLIESDLIPIMQTPDHLLSPFQEAPDFTTSDALNQFTASACLELLQYTSEAIKRQNNHYLVAAKEYIAENYKNAELTLSTIANDLDISANYLSRLFSGNLGIPFSNYLNKFRIERSCELLQSTEYMVMDISKQTGFSSPQNFIRVFNKYMNMSPGVYRKHCRDTSSRL